MAIEGALQKLDRKVQSALYNLDENNFSNDYLARVQAEEYSLRQLGHSFDNLRKAKIGEARIENAAISSAKIKEGAIEQAHLQNASVGEAQIKDASISAAKIQDLAVDSAKIQDSAITRAKIQDAAIDSAKIANLAVQTAHIALGAITRALIDSAAVGTAQIADGSITDAKIVELTANKITAGVLEVARLIVTGESSIVEAINSQNNTSQASTNTIDGGAITERSLTADRIVAGAITAREIASKTITANEILAETLTGAEIASDTLTARHIAAGTITADKLESGIGASLDLSSNTAILSKVEREELQSEIQQQAASISQSLQHMQTQVVNVDGRLEEFKQLVNVWQRFSADGLELGRSDSPFGMILSNTRLSFRENGREIAYFANNKLHVLEAAFTQGLSLGNAWDGHFDWKTNAQGLSLFYRQ